MFRPVQMMTTHDGISLHGFALKLAVCLLSVSPVGRRKNTDTLAFVWNVPLKPTLSSSVTLKALDRVCVSRRCQHPTVAFRDEREASPWRPAAEGGVGGGGMGGWGGVKLGHHHHHRLRARISTHTHAHIHQRTYTDAQTYTLLQSHITAEKSEELLR